MKKIYIVAIIMIVAAIGLLTSVAADTSTYGDFSQAIATQKKVKVVGTLAKDRPMEYNPEIDPNHFTFFLTDMNGETHKVVLKAAKPKDFELSEQIVVTGSMKGDEFVASHILMKCPSKYKDEEVQIKEKSAS
ncbi:MAG: cytochrome c maturation protein CcmE [Saprospiraceae bacterium]|nr:cytochrome C biogenesis protein [Saprospirales bacterium]RME09229.1 MAG: cytochrome c maturation protein CcmE [Bacteroidota bacterium]